MYCDLTCPTCFETFSIPGPAPAEVPTQWDYDCEVCCRPMLVHFYLDGETVSAEAEMDQ
jgi:hypothetical protein